MAALAVVGLVDELWSGVAVVAAPEVEQLHEVDHAHYALWIFAVPMLAASLIEMPIALGSDRLPRRWLLAGGLGGLAVSLGLAAIAPSAWLLAAALSLAGAASGVACGAAQAELVTRHPGGVHSAMHRWIAYSAAGDALTPLFVAVAYWAGGTHRSALLVVAVILGLQAIATFFAAPPTETAAMLDDDDEPVMPLRAALASAARKPRLWLFLFAASACTLLDEVVVALAALRLHDDLGWSEGLVAMALCGCSTGGVVGALVSDRLLRHTTPRVLMIGSALGSITFLGAFIAAQSAPGAALALFCLGMTAALHYPLVKAAAFELAPGQPGLVNALAQTFVVVEVVLPLSIGVIASAFGLSLALAALAVEPLVLIAVALTWRQR
jgi:MFS family permease